ncbi:MAG: hypothetical protein CMG21_03365 [Candidatus Marinimicrobia bacterium]|nr:hypothetical protein [Candidatus Neomarinimicrobiota bacterium]
MKNYILKYFPFYGLAVFFLCNIIAMYFYAGGSIFNPDSVGYDFFRNYLSQLGRIRGINGEDNLISFRIWSSGMAATGLIFIIYYISLPSFFEMKKIAIIGSFTSIVSCICFIFTGITPGDVVLNLSSFNKDIYVSINRIYVYELHKFFANNIFYFGLLSALIYSYIIYYSEKINSIYGMGYYLFSVLIFLYVLILIYGPSPFSSPSALIFQVTAQKVISISWVMCTFVLSLGIKNILDAKK